MGCGAHSLGLGVEDNTLIAVGMRNVPTMTSFNSTSFLEVLPSGVEVDITPIATAYVFPPETGEAMTTVSTDVGDVGVVRVRGLDENFLEQEEFLVVNGTTPISLTGLWSHINAARIIAGPTPIGVITIQGTNVWSQIDPEKCQAFDGIYTIPSNKIAYILKSVGTMLRVSNQDSAVLLKLYTRSLLPTGPAPWVLEVPFALQQRGTSDIDFNNIVPDPGPGPIDVRVTAEASNAGSGVATRITILLQDK